MAFPYLSDVVKAFTGFDLPLPLPMFGLFVALAMLTAGACLKAELGRLYAAGKLGAATVRRKGSDGVVSCCAVPPQEIVADLTVVAMIAGIVGARLFHILEYTDAFFADPLGMLWTTSGLSIFGGLILGTLAGLACMKRWKLPLRPVLDAVAPAMMLGYAIGRVGCQISGDGDWGTMANLALKPAWMPLWAWAQTYDNNIVGVLIARPGVYPTPLYETLMALAAFAMLWLLRRHPFQAGWLFSLYLVLAGIERMAIETIRINPVFNVFGLHATQAEIIGALLIVGGLAGLALLSKRPVPLAQAHPPAKPPLASARPSNQ